MASIEELPNDKSIIESVADPMDAVFRASCIVGHVQRYMMDNDLVLIGETLRLAEELLAAAHTRMWRNVELEQIKTERDALQERGAAGTVEVRS